MSEKKVYSVAVEVTFNMAVVASSKEEAEKIARESFDEEMENVRPIVDFSAHRISTCPREFKGTLPYGVVDSDPRRNWPIEKWLEKEPVNG